MAHFRLSMKVRFWMGHTPSTAGTFRKKFRKNSGKTPETLSEHFLEFLSSVSRILSPPVRLGTPLFSELVPERASQSRCHGIPSSTGGISEKNLKFRRVTIRGPQPSTRLSEEICLPEGSAGVSQRPLRGSLRGSARDFPRVFGGGDPMLVTLRNCWREGCVAVRNSLLERFNHVLLNLGAISLCLCAFLGLDRGPPGNGQRSEKRARRSTPVILTLFCQSLRALSLKKIQILKFSSEIEIFKRATHQPPFFCGEF